MIEIVRFPKTYEIWFLKYNDAFFPKKKHDFFQNRWDDKFTVEGESNDNVSFAPELRVLPEIREFLNFAKIQKISWR